MDKIISGEDYKMEKYGLKFWSRMNWIILFVGPHYQQMDVLLNDQKILKCSEKSINIVSKTCVIKSFRLLLALILKYQRGYLLHRRNLFKISNKCKTSIYSYAIRYKLGSLFNLNYNQSILLLKTIINSISYYKL